MRVVAAGGRTVMLVDRFDRPAHPTRAGVRTRRQVVSMLTVLGMNKMGSHHATYAQIADTIRTGPWTDVQATLTEVFTRLVLSILVGNNDDHLRNHAAFWDRSCLTLTPAYDLAPQPRSVTTSTQAIGITRDGQRASQLRLCRAVAPDSRRPPQRRSSTVSGAPSPTTGTTRATSPSSPPTSARPCTAGSSATSTPSGTAPDPRARTMGTVPMSCLVSALST
ncbi:MAG: HipA domain-containing protein [Micrococcales bacterium]|nr:HipA domain-containing protein [Micrococcales bacterium]MCL2666722.1 HipA domain-containing protein [Micrococcales bacterium]